MSNPSFIDKKLRPRKDKRIIQDRMHAYHIVGTGTQWSFLARSSEHHSTTSSFGIFLDEVSSKIVYNSIFHHVLSHVFSLVLLMEYS